MNPFKSESLLMGTVAGTGSLSDFGSVIIADAQVCISDTVISLVVMHDTNLIFRPHVDAVCKSCFFHIRAFATCDKLFASRPPQFSFNQYRKFQIRLL